MTSWAKFRLVLYVGATVAITVGVAWSGWTTYQASKAMGRIDSVYFEQPERMLASFSAIESNVPVAVIQLNQLLLRAVMSDAQIGWEQFEKAAKNLQDFLHTQKSVAPAGKTLFQR